MDETLRGRRCCVLAGQAGSLPAQGAVRRACRRRRRAAHLVLPCLRRTSGARFRAGCTRWAGTVCDSAVPVTRTRVPAGQNLEEYAAAVSACGPDAPSGARPSSPTTVGPGKGRTHGRCSLVDHDRTRFVAQLGAVAFRRRCRDRRVVPSARLARERGAVRLSDGADALDRIGGVAAPCGRGCRSGWLPASGKLSRCVWGGSRSGPTRLETSAVALVAWRYPPGAGGLVFVLAFALPALGFRIIYSTTVQAGARTLSVLVAIYVGSAMNPSSLNRQAPVHGARRCPCRLTLPWRSPGWSACAQRSRSVVESPTNSAVTLPRAKGRKDVHAAMLRGVLELLHGRTMHASSSGTRLTACGQRRRQGPMPSDVRTAGGEPLTALPWVREAMGLASPPTASRSTTSVRCDRRSASTRSSPRCSSSRFGTASRFGRCRSPRGSRSRRCPRRHRVRGQDRRDRPGVDRARHARAGRDARAQLLRPGHPVGQPGAATATPGAGTGAASTSWSLC